MKEVEGGGTDNERVTKARESISYADSGLIKKKEEKGRGAHTLVTGDGRSGDGDATSRRASHRVKHCQPGWRPRINVGARVGGERRGAEERGRGGETRRGREGDGMKTTAVRT